MGMNGKGNVGVTGCTTEEYKTHFSLWALLNSPLMIGCDIRNMDEDTKKILMNKEVLKINNTELISAIRYHTTAKRDMSLLEKIIYVADFTSADRNYPDVNVMRALADKSLEEAMIYALKYTIPKLLECDSAVHPDTLDAYNFLKVRFSFEK